MLTFVLRRTASPYLPQQWNYNDSKPTQAYDQFSFEAGCVDDEGHSYNNRSVLECLKLANTAILQNASAKVGAGYKYGQWAFVPVTDKQFLSERPSVQLKAGKVNGLRMLTSVSPTVLLSSDRYLRTGRYNTLLSSHTDRCVYMYRITKTRVKDLRRRISRPPLICKNSSPGYFPPWRTIIAIASSKHIRLPQSSSDHCSAHSEIAAQPHSTRVNLVSASSNHQRANNLYAETTFICPSYWLADAFSCSTPAARCGRNATRNAWNYQFSVPPSEHGADLNSYQAFNREALGLGSMTEAARKAIQLAWGRFIIHDDPTLPATVVADMVTAVSAGGNHTRDDIHAISTVKWTEWHQSSPGRGMLNVNMAGGVPVEGEEG